MSVIILESVRQPALRLGFSAGARGFSYVAIGAAVSGMSLTWPAAAVGAEARTEPIRIEYQAPLGESCPSALQFETQVLERTQGARAARPSEVARAFVVKLARVKPANSGSPFVGTLVVEEEDGESTARQVKGTTCADVASVLALATALAIDPLAELETSADHTPELPADPAPAPSAEVPNEGEESPWSARVAMGAAGWLSAAPDPALGATARIALQHRGAIPWEVGLEFAYLFAPEASIGTAAARFQWLLVAPSLCAGSLELSALRIRPCIAADLGMISAQATGLDDQSPSERFWLSPETLVQLELSMPQGWFVNLEGGAAWPLTRYRFSVRSPQTTLHEIPPVTGRANLRVGFAL